MDSAARKTLSPPSVLIDGVPHRQCGDGRKQRRAGAIECGEIKPVSQFVLNAGYSDGHGLICAECSDKQNARYAERVKNAIVPIKIYDDVPIGGDGCSRGASILVDGIETPHLVVSETCRYWGLDTQGQTQRIQDDPALSAGLVVCKMHTSQGCVPAYVLRYDLVPLWLAGIETGKMRNKERAAQLATYQKVCGQVLADYFFGTQTAPPAPIDRVPFDEPLAGYDDAQVLRYLDTALDRFTDRLEARARSIVAPYLDTVREVHRETFIDVRGVVYVCKYPRYDAWPDSEQFYAMGWDRYAIGWTTKLSVEERLKEYPGKYDIEHPEELYVIKTDSSKLEGIVHERRPRKGVFKVPHRRDIFWLSPEALELLRQLPDHIAHETARNKLIGWVLVRKGSEVSLA